MLVVYNQLLNKLFNVIVEIKLIISFKTNSKQNVWIKGIKINFNFEIIWYLSVQCNPPPNVQSDKLRNTKLLWPTLSRNDLIVENVVQLLRTNGICMEHYQDQYVQGHTMAETVELLYSKTLVGLGWMSHFWVFTLIWRISEQFRIRKKKDFQLSVPLPYSKTALFSYHFFGEERVNPGWPKAFGGGIFGKLRYRESTLDMTTTIGHLFPSFLPVVQFSSQNGRWIVSTKVELLLVDTYDELFSLFLVEVLLYFIWLLVLVFLLVQLWK